MVAPLVHDEAALLSPEDRFAGVGQHHQDPVDHFATQLRYVQGQSDGQPDHEHQERHGRGEGDVPEQGAEEGGGKGRLEQEATEVVEPDTDLPPLGQSLAVLVVEGTALVVGVVGLAGLGVLDTVTCVVVDVLGVALCDCK